MSCPNRPHGEYDDYCEACDGHRTPVTPLERPVPVRGMGSMGRWSPSSDDFLHRALAWRGVESEACQSCAGAGARLYSSTSTWRGGMGGQMFTRDVCDQCWGSGAAAQPWLNLRTLRDDTSRQIAERAVGALAQACGATLTSARPQVQALVDVLRASADQADRARKPKPGQDSIWYAPLARGLAALLERAIST